jgi:hypothetical protein
MENIFVPLKYNAKHWVPVFPFLEACLFFGSGSKVCSSEIAILLFGKTEAYKNEDELCIFIFILRICKWIQKVF